MHADIAQTVHRMAHTCGVRNYLGGQWCDLGRKANGDAMLADILFQGLYPDDDDTGAKIYGDFTIRKVVGGDGKVSHNDHEDPEGSITNGINTNGIKDKAKQYLEAVNDRRVRVDALVINSGGRMSKCFDTLLYVLAKRKVTKELGPMEDVDDWEEVVERRHCIARAKHEMQGAVQVARVRAQFSIIWAVSERTNSQRVQVRKKRTQELGPSSSLAAV